VSLRETLGRLARPLAALALAGYAVLLLAHLGRGGFGGSDSSGYANTARDILSGRIVQPVEALARLGLPARFDRVFIPLAFEPGPRPATMVPMYPPGFPLHVAAAAWIAGWSVAPFLVSPLAAVLCILLVYQLGREFGLSRPLSLAGGAMFGVLPVMFYHAELPMSDVVAAMWAVAAVIFALRSGRGAAWAAAAGAAFGIAVLVRPTNALLVLPIALAFGRRPKSYIAFLLGGLPLAGFFAAWNHAAYGGALRSGYAGILGQELAAANFPPRFKHYSFWIAAQLSPLVPLGWLAATADRRLPGRTRAILFLWFAPFFLFYCFWGPYEIWWYTRYLLPALPALIVGFLLGARELVRRLPAAASAPWWMRPRLLMTLGLIAIVAICERTVERRQRPLGAARGEVVFPDASRAIAAASAGSRALVVSMEFSGALRFYTDLTPTRWDWLEPADFVELRRLANEKGVRIFAVLLRGEVQKAAPHVPGEWKFLENVGNASLWELPRP
jgi:4-amino-4-deoxy-L-arabinose transferase-like glycosyltransferase